MCFEYLAPRGYTVAYLFDRYNRRLSVLSSDLDDVRNQRKILARCSFLVFKYLCCGSPSARLQAGVIQQLLHTYSRKTDIAAAKDWTICLMQKVFCFKRTILNSPRARRTSWGCSGTRSKQGCRTIHPDIRRNCRHLYP